MPTIFDRNVLPGVGQLRAVADRRFRDAEALLATGDNERAAGAMYLGGYAVEVLLKGQLLARHPAAARPLPATAGDDERAARVLIFRSHALDDMLAALPDIEAMIKQAGDRASRPYHEQLKQLCGTWTPYARYSPRSTTIREARDFLDRVRAIKELLK